MYKTQKQKNSAISKLAFYDIWGYNISNYYIQNNKNIAISDTIRGHFKTLSKRSG